MGGVPSSGSLGLALPTGKWEQTEEGDGPVFTELAASGG